MTKNALTRALKAYRLELGPGEDRSAATLQRILESWSLRRRVRSLLWVGVLTCSSVAAAAAIHGLGTVISPRVEAAATRVNAPVVQHALSAVPGVAEVEAAIELAPSPASVAPTGLNAPARPGSGRTASPRKAGRVAMDERPGTKISPAADVTASASASRARLMPQTALQAEGELLQRGRVALTRGDIDGALSAVDEHTARFPQGQLAEEREALRIQALVAEDRNPEARAALGGFRRAYPASVSVPALEEAVLGHELPGSGAESR